MDDQTQAALDELLLGAGVKEREQHTLADRDRYAVVTDPNTELLKQLVQEVRMLTRRVDQLGAELQRHGPSPFVDRYEAMITSYGNMVQGEPWHIQPVFPQALIDKAKTDMQNALADQLYGIQPWQRGVTGG